MTAAPGISFAIPSKYAIEFIQSEESLAARSKHYYLGMKMISLTPMSCELFSLQSGFDIGLPEHLSQGSLVIEVAPNSPADR